MCNHYHYYLFSNRCFWSKKIVEQTVNSTNSTVTKTKESSDDTKQETLVKIGKNDRTLYTDDSLTTPLATINGGELTEFLSETKNAYQIKTNDGYTGYLALVDGTKVTKNIQTKPKELSDAVIVLDPGHGGNDTGALSNDEQTEEKDITLSTAIKVKKALEDAGATVYLTHTTDELVQLGDICDYSEEKRQMSLSAYMQTLRNMRMKQLGSRHIITMDKRKH